MKLRMVAGVGGKGSSVNAGSEPFELIRRCSQAGARRDKYFEATYVAQDGLIILYRVS